MTEPKTYSGNGLAVEVVDPENITKDECLQLALAGKDAWNSWQSGLKVRTSESDPSQKKGDFSSVDFRDFQINFSGFEFGREANFEGARFGDSTNFSEARFGDFANFSGTNFGNNTWFFGVGFGNCTMFYETVFGHYPESVTS